MIPRSKPPERSLRIGALVVLSGCFVASALLRAGEVVAALPAMADDGFGNPIARTPGSELISGAPDHEQMSKAPEVLLAELKRRREQLDNREADLDDREQTLKTLQQRLSERLAEVREARARLAKTAALVDDAASKDVRRLAEMYQQMKPKQAGQIFNEMAPSFAAGFIAEMRPDAAALIMANMDADKAYAVSLLIAGRNVNHDGAATPDSAEN